MVTLALHWRHSSSYVYQNIKCSGAKAVIWKKQTALFIEHLVVLLFNHDFTKKFLDINPFFGRADQEAHSCTVYKTIITRYIRLKHDHSPK